MLMTYQELYQWLLKELSSRENALNESRWLIENKTQKSFSEVRDFSCLDEDFSRYKEAVKKLKEGIPFQYVLGEQDFYGLSFQVDQRVLVPRPETELLVDSAIQWGKDKTLSVLDVCTGSGCIILALAKHLTGSFYATDLSLDALAVAKNNAKIHKAPISFFQGNLLESIPQNLSFDLITANPPYLTKEEMADIPNELTYEPSMALLGGDDGLIFCNKLIEEVPKRLNSQGAFFMEIGEGQGDAVFNQAKKYFSEAKICKDYNHKDRFLFGIK